MTSAAAPRRMPWLSLQTYLQFSKPGSPTAVKAPAAQAKPCGMRTLAANAWAICTQRPT